MIYARIDDLSRYKGVSRFLDMAIDFIQKTDLRMLKQGRNEVDGDKILAVISKYMKEKGTLKKDTVVATVMSNLGLRKYASANDINFESTKV